MSARPVRRILPLALPSAFLLVLVPSVAAQLPMVTLEVEAAPGAWESDGWLDAGTEQARWAVTATVTFSQTAVCADPVPVDFALTGVSGNGESFAVEPASATVTPPQGGGDVSTASNATFELPAATPADTVTTARLHVVVGACPSPVGTSPRAETNATLSATPLFKPGLDAAWEPAQSFEGVFNFTLTNTGNGPLEVVITVLPKSGSPEQTTAVPTGLLIGVGEFTTAKLEFPERKPGTYDVAIVGTFAGPDPESRASVAKDVAVEVLAQETVTEKKDTPGFGGAALVAALGAVGVALHRRRPR